jgi:hypothetical protein
MASLVPDQRPPGSWKLVAGAWLHFVAPAYLVAIPVAALATAPPGATTSTLLRLALGYSGWFLLAYAALALLSIAAVAALEPALRSGQARREARDPRLAARASERRVTRAVMDGRRQLGDEALRILDAIQGERWHHGDARDQALSADLAEAVRTSIAAIRSAAPERRDEIAALSAASLRRIDSALATLHAERGRLDEGDARTVARYLELRYGNTDSAGEGL